jgi:hypothetical protein
MRALTSAAFRRALLLEVDVNGALTAASIARLCRSAVQRWGVCTDLQLRRFVALQVAAATDDSEAENLAVPDVIEELLRLGDLARVRLDGRRHLARTPPRWIRLTKSLAVLVGTQPTPAALEGQRALAPEMCSRHLKLEATSQALLRGEGVAEQSLSAWLGAPGFLRHLQRRGVRRGAGLSALWETIAEAVGRDGLSVNDSSSLRVVSGSPGDFFGALGEKVTGRWRALEAPGIWLGARPGLGNDRHWLRVAVAVQQDMTTRMLDLYDHDEFHWALIARGVATGQEETPRQDGRQVSFVTPPPQQVARVMTLCAERRLGAWTWELPEGLEHIWRVW